MKKRKNMYCWRHLFGIHLRNADIFQLEVVFAKTFVKNLERHFRKAFLVQFSQQPLYVTASTRTKTQAVWLEQVFIYRKSI